MFFNLITALVISLGSAIAFAETSHQDTITYTFSDDTVDIYIENNNPYDASPFYASGGVNLGYETGGNVNFNMNYTARFYFENKALAYISKESPPLVQDSEFKNSNLGSMEYSLGYVLFSNLVNNEKNKIIHTSFKNGRYNNYLAKVNYLECSHLALSAGFIQATYNLDPRILGDYYSSYAISEGNYYLLGLQYSSFHKLGFSTSKKSSFTSTSFKTMGLHIIYSPQIDFWQSTWYDYNDDGTHSARDLKKMETFPLGIRLTSQSFSPFKNKEMFGIGNFYSIGVMPGLKGDSYADTFLNSFFVSYKFHFYFGIR